VRRLAVFSSQARARVLARRYLAARRPLGLLR